LINIKIYGNANAVSKRSWWC